MSTRWRFAGDGGYAWRVLADLDLSGLPVHVRDEGRALQEQPPVSKHVVRHLEVYRRLGHLRTVLLRYGEVSRPVYQAVVGDLQKFKKVIVATGLPILQVRLNSSCWRNVSTRKVETFFSLNEEDLIRKLLSFTRRGMFNNARK